MYGEIDAFRQRLPHDVKEEWRVRGAEAGHLDIPLIQLQLVAVLGHGPAHVVSAHLQACRRRGPTERGKRNLSGLLLALNSSSFSRGFEIF